MTLFRRDILRDTLGLWVWNTDEQDIGETVQRVVHHGYKWIAVKGQEGGDYYRNASQRLDEWRTACEKHGIHYGVWGFLYGAEPEWEARIASSLVNHGAQFYIADAENGYEEHPEASQDFASGFSKMHPHLPKALSSFGRIDFHRIDWHAWRRHGFTFMPQAYVDVSPLLRPSTCIQVASSVWHPSEMAVTLEAKPGMQYGEYVIEAARKGVRGFNVWRANLVSDIQLAGVYHNR